jgi:hypothetical protein
MKEECRLNTGELVLEVGPQRTKMMDIRRKIRSELKLEGSSIFRKDEGFSDTKTTIKNTRDLNVKSVMEFVVHRPMESAGLGTPFVKMRTGMAIIGNEAFKRTRREDDRRNFRCIVNTRQECNQDK